MASYFGQVCSTGLSAEGTECIMGEPQVGICLREAAAAHWAHRHLLSVFARRSATSLCVTNRRALR